MVGFSLLDHYFVPFILVSTDDIIAVCIRWMLKCDFGANNVVYTWIVAFCSCLE